MAMIRCNVCGKEHSDRAEHCMYCHEKASAKSRNPRVRIQYRVSGTHRETGKPFALSIFAGNEVDARKLATDQGLIVDEVAIIAIEQTADEPSERSSRNRCPNCKSTNTTVQKQGFGLGKAAAGGLLLGPVGLLGGLLGSNKVVIACLNCGKVFEPGAR